MKSNQTNSEALFEELVNQFGESLMRLAYTYVKNHQAAEDIVQDVFLKAFEKQHDFRGKTYCLLIISKLVKHDEPVDLFVINKNENYLLGKKILTLPIKYREVIILHYYSDYSIDEISFILDISPNTIKTRLRRGRQKLKGFLGTMEGEPYGTEG